jgi:hypothetical protein
MESELEGLLHGTSLNQITNIIGLENRAARQLLLDLDPQETKRTVEFVNPIFNSVFDYPIADDVKGNKLIDIFPQVQRIPQDIWTQAYNQAFDVAKQNIFSFQNMFTMNFNTGIKTIKLNCPFLNPPIIINQIEAIATNGTWAVGGTASSLAVNNTNFAQGSGSLQFNVTSGAAYLENTTMTSIDLSEVENQSSIFTWVYIPTGSSLTSVNLRFGSSSANYWSLTVTQNQQGTAFVNGWNLCQFTWSSMSSTGTPDSSAIDYARITLNVTGTMTGCLINGLDSILGTILNYSYYSKYLFRDSTTGAFQETVTDTSNLINLDTESYNLYVNLVALYAVQQQQGMDGLFFDAQYFQDAYDKGLARYKAMYKSELQKPQSVYYKQPNTSYHRILGSRGWY